MRDNGSPVPIFETDEQCTYFLTTLPARVSVQVSDQEKTITINTLEEFFAFQEKGSVQVSVEVSDQAGWIINIGSTVAFPAPLR